MGIGCSVASVQDPFAASTVMPADQVSSPIAWGGENSPDDQRPGPRREGSRSFFPPPVSESPYARPAVPRHSSTILSMLDAAAPPTAGSATGAAGLASPHTPRRWSRSAPLCPLDPANMLAPRPGRFVVAAENGRVWWQAQAVDGVTNAVPRVILSPAGRQLDSFDKVRGGPSLASTPPRSHHLEKGDSVARIAAVSVCHFFLWTVFGGGLICAFFVPFSTAL